MEPSQQPSPPEPTTRTVDLVQGPSLPATLEVTVRSPVLAGPPWHIGQVLLDEFAVEGILGQGGMGVVHLVRQLSTGKKLAAKRTRLLDPINRRRFLAELQTWIDLPDHPHLAFCRFFRTIDDEVVIFTDYAEGGSLADQIQNRRLTDLVKILDVAIQVAWGLHALHQCGLVHQDVKPANVLMTADGRAQVADFGLARARSRVQLPEQADTTPTCLVSGGAMTPAYCSPEQARGEAVSRRTDVWSWGILVLEMFAGQVPCCAAGPQASAVLEQLAPRLPKELAALLRECFQVDPIQRPANLAGLVERLLAIYQAEIGKSYPRRVPELAPLGQHSGGRVSTSDEARWQPPRVWLCRALQARGHDPSELDGVLPPLASSRKGQAVADLTVYEEARQLYERCLDEGRYDVQAELAELCLQKALVHRAVGDLPGSLAACDRAVELWQALVEHQGRRELTGPLARAYLQRIRTLRLLGDHSAALASCDRIFELHQRLSNRRRRLELREDLAAAHVHRGLIRRALGDNRGAVPCFDSAIDLWEQVVSDASSPELQNDLAWAYLTKASVLSALNQGREALDLCERAIAVRRRLVQREGLLAYRADLARAYLNKANAIRGLGNAQAALTVYDEAIDILQRLVRNEGRDDLTHDLARVLLARGQALRKLREHRQAALQCAEAAQILEQLSQREGRRELAWELAKAYLHQGNALRAGGQFSDAYQLCRKSAQVFQRLVEEDRREEYRGDLARALAGAAQALRRLGSPRKALHLFNEAMSWREPLLTSGPEEIRIDHARDQLHRAEVLLDTGEEGSARPDLEAVVATLQPLAEARSDLRGLLQRARSLLRSCP